MHVHIIIVALDGKLMRNKLICNDSVGHPLSLSLSVAALDGAECLAMARMAPTDRHDHPLHFRGILIKYKK